MAVLESGDAFTFHVSGSHSDGTDISSAVTLTVPDGATKLLIQAIDQNARFTLDGTAPTTSKGFQLVAGEPPMIIPVGNGMTIKVIEEAASCDLQYQWGY
jgi:hypothetical protein